MSFFRLVRAQVKFEPMRDHFLFLGLLDSAGVAFLGVESHRSRKQR
jgi:hypothetical protein